MRYCLLFLSLLALTACYDEPKFPEAPEISFQGVRFFDGSVSDSLLITVDFQDGNGDLGLSSFQIDRPYQIYDSLFTINGTSSYIKIGQFDTLPDHNCVNYRSGYFNESGRFIYTLNRQDITDTIYVRPNPYYYNFFVDLYTIVRGEEQRVDLIEYNYPTCGGTLNGRFQLNPDNSKMALSGTITYSIPSQILLPFFGDDSLKVKVRIADRALNMSNLVESPAFTLRGIQVK